MEENTQPSPIKIKILKVFFFNQQLMTEIYSLVFLCLLQITLYLLPAISNCVVDANLVDQINL